MGPCWREDQFARRYGLVPQEPKSHPKARARERRFLEAAYWMGRSGAQCRFLPTEYGRWNRVYQRFASTVIWLK